MSSVTARLKEYIAARRSLGYDLTFSERVLRRFIKFAEYRGRRPYYGRSVPPLERTTTVRRITTHGPRGSACCASSQAGCGVLIRATKFPLPAQSRESHAERGPTSRTRSGREPQQ
jgi:hypothetical protein